MQLQYSLWLSLLIIWLGLGVHTFSIELWPRLLWRKFFWRVDGGVRTHGKKCFSGSALRTCLWLGGLEGGRLRRAWPWPWRDRGIASSGISQHTVQIDVLRFSFEQITARNRLLLVWLACRKCICRAFMYCLQETRASQSWF